MKHILIVGFGRMGLTHSTIISGILGHDTVQLTIVDPSLASRLIAKFLFPSARILSYEDFKKLISAGEVFDFAIITTPPSLRGELSEMLVKASKATLIEKPVISHLLNGQMSGYVLQHAPLNLKVKEMLRGRSILSMDASLTTNVNFESITKGWRASNFGSVLHEFGGHVLSVLATISPDQSVFCNLKKKEQVNIESSSRNHVKFSFNEAGVNYAVSLIAASNSVRKASYNFRINCVDEIIEYDLYSVRSVITNSILTNVASEGVTTNFYVRGFEFSKQIEALLSGKGDVLSSSQIYNLEEILRLVEA